MTDAAADPRLRDDAAARRRAVLAFERPLALEAGAGTGKTSVLIARVVAWTLGPGWERARERVGAAGASAGDVDRIAADALSRVAAITFTEAAAAEMAHRTGQALRDVAVGRPVIGLPGDALPPEDLRRPRARALLGALDRLPVRTIHAFCRRILAAHPLEADLHPAFRVDADGAEQARAVREVVEAAVRAGYGHPGDPDLVALAEDRVGPTELEKAVATLVAEDVPAAELAESPFGSDRVAALRHHVAAACEKLLGLEAGRLAAARRVRKAHETMDAIRALARAAAGPAEDFLARVSKLDLDGLARGSRLDAWRHGDTNQSEGRALADVDPAAFADAAERLRALAAHLAALDPAKLERAFRVVHPMLADAHEALRRRGAVGFQALLRRARRLLYERPDVASRLRRELDQLLVDEFQDTDRIQCDVVRALALRGPEGERPGLFVVGDPKQSIYGWRNADLRAYDDFLDDLTAAGGSRHGLVENHRSLPAVLEEVERVIAPVMRAERGLQPPYQALLACERRVVQMRERGSTPPCVEHWITWERGAEGWEAPGAVDAAELEARALARDLRARREAGELDWSDAAILVRATSDLETYLRELRAAGIPYAIERDRSYYQRREVIDAAALVRCVLDPHDQLALVTWLRSPAVGVPDAAWLPLWRRDFPRRMAELVRPDPDRLGELWDAIDAVAGEIAGDVPGLDRVRGWQESLSFAVATIAKLREDFERDPADVFVERLRRLTLLEVGEAARFLGPFRVANLGRFFRELRDGLEHGADPQALLRRLRQGVAAEREVDEGIRRESAESAVRVMTIHAAKGLDFRHVYVAQLHKESSPRGPDAPARVGQGERGLELELFGAPTPGFHEAEAQRLRVEAAERVRTLYVAMTRAEERLVLLGSWPRGERAPEPGRARSHAELLARRHGGDALAMEERLEALAVSGDGDALDDGGVRWRVPGLSLRDAAAPRPVAAARRAAGFDARALAAAADTVRERVVAAERRMQRTFAGAATRDDPEREREEAVRRRFPDASAPAGRAGGDGVAAAAGTAVHRVLEELDLAAADPHAELARWRARLPALAASEADAGAAEAVAERAAGLLDGFARGSLHGRLRALRDRIVARELPVLVPPPGDGDDAGAVGFVAGTLDLVYRDPDTERLVVADYKTDRVRSDAEVAERVRHHASQGALYASALRDALGLDYTPRFELWLLRADRIEAVPMAEEER